MRAWIRARRRWLLPLAALACAWPAWNFAAYATAVRVYAIAGGSMAPTLVAGDRVGVEARGVAAMPGRGELWVYTRPGGNAGIARVIGLPGETVEVAGGQVLVDGRPIAEPYLTGPVPYAMAPVRLDPGQVFLLGDNRGVSNDGHNWGPLHERNLIGRARYRCWPTDRAGALK